LPRALATVQVPWTGMTESLDLTAPPAAAETQQAVIAEALAVIDQALGQMMGRELVSSGEVADLLLDVRTLLTAPAERV
jgi:hypothetical protein